jgi:ribosomal protein S18 acetylase RimI-like enzyme
MVVPATPADIDAIMACERSPGYEATVGRWSREEHLAGMADPTHRYYIARQPDGGIAGFVMLQEVGNAADSILVRRIAVSEQRRGHGRQLLGHALQVIFDEFGARSARLGVRAHNASGIALYSSLGMREESRREEPGHNGQTVTAITMTMSAETYRQPKRSNP